MKIKARSYVHDRLFSESTHPGLTAGRIYYVVGVEDDHFRVINDDGEPILYEIGIFDVVDPSIPDDWVTRWFDDGDTKYCYIDPPGLGGRGFYEDYFDGVSYAVTRFRAYCKLAEIPCDRKKSNS
jgi:hypothetical protein